MRDRSSIDPVVKAPSGEAPWWAGLVAFGLIFLFQALKNADQRHATTFAPDVPSGSDDPR